MSNLVYVIGRNPVTQPGEIAIPINDNSKKVSSSHCKIYFDGTNYFIEDMGSTNHTFVNGQIINGRTPIFPSSMITLGKNFQFNLSSLPKNADSHNNADSSLSSEYADWGSRLAAHFLDILFFNLIVLIPVYLLIYLVFGISMSDFFDTYGVTFNSSNVALIYVIWIVGSLVLFHFYYAVSLNKSGQTWGKKLLNIKVVDASTGNYPSIGQGWGRQLSKIISGLILSVGFFMPLWTSKKQALHDMMASTLVLKK